MMESKLTDEQMVNVLMMRAAAHLVLANYPSALADVRSARRLSPSDPHLIMLQQKIEKTIHSVTHKDYYEILGLEKGASPEAIRKAYRRLVREYHPDKNKEPDAEQRFLDIVEAYEVLSDPELRAVYDEGRDIADFMERRKRQQQEAQSQRPQPPPPPPPKEVRRFGKRNGLIF